MPRRVLLIGIALVVIIVPAIVILMLVDRNPDLQNRIENIANRNTGTANTNQIVSNSNTEEDPTLESIRYVSRNFAEVYGNESNQNDFKNLIDAQVWGTANFNEFLNRTIAQGRLTQESDPYHAFTTKAVVLTVTRQASTTASLTVSTQRTETTGDTEDTYYQDLFLDLVKQGEDWKINAAAWDPR